MPTEKRGCLVRAIQMGGVFMEYVANPDLDFDQVLHLYQANQWTNYTTHPEMLSQAISHSLYILACFEEGELVGLIRLVGDGYSIIFIQDILVLPDYQGQGIGTLLMKQALNEFKEVYQIHLLTDKTEKTKAFYESLGFIEVGGMECRAYSYLPH